MKKGVREEERKVVRKRKNANEGEGIIGGERMRSSRVREGTGSNKIDTVWFQINLAFHLILTHPGP